MPRPDTLRIKIIKACIVEKNQDGYPGDVFDVSRMRAALLVGDGLAVLLEPGRANYSVTMEQPEHGDPVARKVSSGPPEKVGAKKE
jgi:hypothetical protein